MNGNQDESGHFIDKATKTPRTDNQLKLEAFFDGAGIVETVLVEFAEQLETELADKDKQLAEARAEIERLKCCGNCADNHANKSKKVCKTCVRNLYGTKQSDNWSHKAAERGE